MTEQTRINLDTSVLMNYLYSTVLPEDGGVGTQFEKEKGCREYFDSSNVFLVAGGKAVGEFENRCEKREDLYEDIVDFMEETGKEIFHYEPKERNTYTNPHDETHTRRGVQMNLANQDAAGQLSTMRRAHQQLEKCLRHILQTALDDTFEQFSDGDLRDAIDTELDINHDCDIIVDAAYLCRDEAVELLAALDSDITEDVHTKEIDRLIGENFDPDVSLAIIDPKQHSLS